MKISSSLLTKYKEVQSGDLCGLQFEQEFVLKNKDFVADTPAVQNGKAFEHKLTCAGDEINFTTTKTGFTADSTRLMQHLSLESFDSNNYEKAMLIELEFNTKTYKMIIDLVDVSTGTPTKIIDIKTTGQINDSFNGSGWGDIVNSPKLDQAKFYVWAWQKVTGFLLPFEFWVYSTKDLDAKIIAIDFKQETIDMFEVELVELVNDFENDLMFGFTAHPSRLACAHCPLVRCKKMNTSKRIETFEI